MITFKSFLVESLMSGFSVVSDDKIDPPTHIERDEEGKIVYREWRKNGKLHRDNDKPAVILSDYDFIDDDQLADYRLQKQTLIWYKNGIISRGNLPARIIYMFSFYGPDTNWEIVKKANSKKVIYETYSGGKKVKSIVVEDTRNNGRVVSYLNAQGRLHRLDGPAKMTRQLNIQGEYKQYYINGKAYEEEDFLKFTGTSKSSTLQDVVDLFDLF